MALDEFLAHPLLGIGADNFQQQYLAHGRSEETPHYPHSVELRTLVADGPRGGAAGGRRPRRGAAGARRARCAGADPLGARVAARRSRGSPTGSSTARSTGSGSSPGWARRRSRCSASPARSRRRARAGARAQSGAGARAAAEPATGRGAASAASPRVADPASRRGVLVARSPPSRSAAPWLSQLEVQSAARVWTTAPQTRLRAAGDAARPEPAQRRAGPGRGQHRAALSANSRAPTASSRWRSQRTPGDAYATLERGAIASTRASARGARAARAGRAPEPARTAHQAEALELVRRRRRVDVEELNRSILLKAAAARVRRGRVYSRKATRNSLDTRRQCFASVCAEHSSIRRWPRLCAQVIWRS